MRKTFTYLSLLIGFLFLALGYNAKAQLNQEDTWVRVNRGFAQCAPLGGFAGEAEWFNDNFSIRKMINRRGEAYAYIEFPSSSCPAGLFRHDTVSNRWFRVANAFSGYRDLHSNNTDIIFEVGYPNAGIYKLNTDYVNFPNGWQLIARFNWNQLPNNGCRSGMADNGVGGEIRAFIGDTIYVQQDHPCGNANQILKFYTGAGVVQFPNHIFAEPIEDFHWQGNASTLPRLYNSDHFTNFFVTIPVGGTFKYFSYHRDMGNNFNTPDYLYTWDPRSMPATQYSGMAPYRTDMIELGGNILFTADDGTNGYELWKSDGSGGGTSMVRDINEGRNRVSKHAYRRVPKGHTKIGSTVYFAGYNPTTGYELWKTDGTNSGTQLVLDIFTGTSNGEPNNSEPLNLYAVGSTLFFTATTSAHGRELWRSDGTAGGTVRISDIATGTGSSNPGSFMHIGTTLYFAASNAAGDRELYRCNSPYTSVELVSNINSGGSSDPQHLVNANGTLIFSANDGVNGRELFKFDGSAVTIVRNIWASGGTNGNSNPKNLYVHGNRVYFAANDSINGAEPWFTDPPYNSGSTQMLTNIRVGAGLGSIPNEFTAIGDTVFFRAYSAGFGLELWKTGGTAASTRLIADINAGPGGSAPMSLTNMNGILVFTANDSLSGRELYRCGPSVFNSVTRLEIAPGAPSSNPINLTVVGTQVFFAATHPTTGTELYRYTGTGAPILVNNISSANKPYGWRNISKGPDYQNLTGSSNPANNELASFDYYDSDTWIGTIRRDRPLNNWAGISSVVLSFDKKDLFFTTQTGAYKWIGSGYEFFLARREGFTLFPTNNGIYFISRAGVTRINQAITSSVGNNDFFPTCVHSSLRHFMSPDDGKTVYVVKFDMRDPNVCSWTGGSGAEMGIFRCMVDNDKPGNTRNISLSAAGYVGGTGADDPRGIAHVGRPVPSATRQPDLFVAGNFPTLAATITDRLPAVVKTFNVGPYTSVSGARARVLRQNFIGDTLKEIIQLGRNADDRVHDFDYISRPKGSIGRRMAITGDFGLVVLDSVGNLIYRIADADLPGTPSPNHELKVDIDNNGHVVVLRSGGTSTQFNHPFRVFNENGTPITGVSTVTRQFCYDIAIQNDTVIAVGFRNGCLPANPPYCNGAGGNPGSCSGAEIQTAYLWHYRLGATASDPMVRYAVTYDYRDGTQGRDIADTRLYKVEFGDDGWPYFAGESAGSETIFRWDGSLWGTVELNSVRLGLCDSLLTVVNGSLSQQGMVRVSRFADLSNTASAHIGFYGRVNHRVVTRGNFCNVDRGEFVIPRLGTGISNTFRLSGNHGFIAADKDGVVYLTGTSAFQFAGRPSQKVNGQGIGTYAGDATILITNKNFGTVRFWGTLGKGSGPSDLSPKAVGRQIAVYDTTVTYCAMLEEREFHTYEPSLNTSTFSPTTSSPDGYYAIFHADLSKFANRDPIIETVRPGDTIVPPNVLAVRTNFSANNLTVCQNGSGTFQSTFTQNSNILDPVANTGWTWQLRYNFGAGATVLSGQQNFTGTINQGLTGHVPPVVAWNTTGLKTVTLRLVGTHATFDSVVREEVKFNYINVLPSSVSLQSLQGSSIICQGGVLEYEALVDQVVAWGINSYTWTVPSGATILSGQGSRKIRVMFGATGGNVQVVANTQCGSSAPLTRNVTITAPSFQALLIAGSMNLTAGEIALRNELQTRGFTVTVREDNDFSDDELLCRNLIVLTSTVDSTLIQGRVRNIETPVVVMNPRLLPAMGMTGNTRDVDYGIESSQTNINITFMSASDLLGGTPPGNTQVAGNLGKNFGWGDANANAIKIAQIGAETNKGVYFAYNAGVNMAGGINAPARRVFYFPADRQAIDSLNTTGRFLLSRALCYATNSCNIPLITTRPISRMAWYPYDTIHVRFTTTGTFNSGNKFYAQFSDKFGDFSNPTIAGQVTLSGNNVSGTVIIDPMPSLPPGANYALRIISDNPSALGTIISPITIYDELTGPDKILFITNKTGPGEQLDVHDRSFYNYLQRFGMPVEYIKMSDVSALRLAGTKLIIIGANAETGAARNTQWNLLRTTNIPIMATQAFDRINASTGNLGMILGRNTPSNYQVQEEVTYSFAMDGSKPPFTNGFDGVYPLYKSTTAYADARSSAIVQSTQLTNDAVVISRFNYSSTSRVHAFYYPAGSQMNSVTANGMRLFFGVELTGNRERFDNLSDEAKLVLDRMIRFATGRADYAELTLASVDPATSFCEGSQFTINLNGQGTFADTNQFVVELSGPNGWFNEPGYPLVLNQVQSTSIEPITVTLPTGLPVGDQYRIRIRTTMPERSIILADTGYQFLIDDRNVSRRTSSQSFATTNDQRLENFGGNSNPHTSTAEITNARVGNSYMYQHGSNDAARWMRFTPVLPSTSWYDVYIIYPSFSNNISNAQFRVIHKNGTSTVTVNQNINTGRWVKLGAYEFDAGDGGYVEFTGANQGLKLDAVRFVRNLNHPANAPLAGEKLLTIGNIWTGAEDRNWHNPNNWSLCEATSSGIPDSTIDVLIPASFANANNFPIISQADAVVRRLTVASGDGKLWINGRTLKATQSITNEDTIRLLNYAQIVGSGPLKTDIFNNAVIVADTAYRLQARLVNNGIFDTRTYYGAGGDQFITRLENTGTGTFTSALYRRLVVPEGITTANVLNIGRRSILEGDVTVTAGTTNLRGGAVIIGNVTQSGGTFNFRNQHQNDSSVVRGNFTNTNGTIAHVVDTSGTVFRNIRVTGLMTIGGSMTLSQGNTNPRDIIHVNADIVNNGIFSIQASPGRESSIIFRSFVNNGLFNASSANATGALIGGGLFTNNGHMVIASDASNANNWFEFEDLVNNGNISSLRARVAGRKLVNSPTGTVTFGPITTTATQLFRFHEFINQGTANIFEYTGTANGSGITASIHNLINQDGATLNFGVVNSSFTNGPRNLTVTGDLVNDGTMNLNANVILASKINKIQQLKGLGTFAGNITVDNENSPAANPIESSFESNRFMRMYGYWQINGHASNAQTTTIGQWRMRALAKNHADSIVMVANLPTNGNYHVYVYFRAETGNCTDTRHRVYHNGTFTDFRVNQTGTSSWRQLTTTPIFFSNDGTERIVIGGELHTTCAFAADGVRFEYVNGSSESLDGGVHLASNLTLNGDLTLTNGKLYLRDSNLELGNSSTLTGANSSRYIVANSSFTGGRLIRNVSASAVAFPVGVEQGYAPVTITQGGNKKWSVGAVSGVLTEVTTGSFVEENVLDRSWRISPESATSGVTLDLGWSTAAPNPELLGFTRGTADLFSGTGTTWNNVGTPTISGSFNANMTGVSINPNTVFHLASGALVSADRTWNGSQSTAWDNNLNWTPNSVPTNRSRVFIPGSVPNNPVIGSGNFEALDLNVTTGNLTISGGSLSLSGSFNKAVTGSFTQSGGTVVMAGAIGTKILGNPSFGNLTISNPSGVTSPNNAWGAVNLTIASTGRLIVPSDSTAAEISVSGNFDNGSGGAFQHSAGKVIMNGTGAQEIRGINTFHTLRINNSGAGVNLINHDTISNALEFQNGVITLGNFNLVLKQGATTSGASANSYVRTNTGNSGGTLQQFVGNSDVVFPVGTTDYAPMTVRNGRDKRHDVRVFNGLLDQAVTGSPITEKAVNRTWYMMPDYSNENILLDNGDPEISLFRWPSGGSNNTGFTTSTAGNPWNGSAWNVNNNAGGTPDVIRILPNFQTRGFYEVFIYFPSGSNMSNVNYIVDHLNGSTTIGINPQAVNNRWVSLGTYEFEVGQNSGSGNIRISTNTGGSSYRVDAFRFDFRKPSGAGPNITLQWNQSNEMGTFDIARVKMGAHTGTNLNGWVFQPAINITGTTTKVGTTDTVSLYPYLCVGGWGTNRWVGGVDSSWVNPNNWSIGLPNESDDIVIPAVVASARGPRVSSGDLAMCRSLALESGANGRLRINGGNLMVMGSLVNNGQIFHVDGKVIMAGNSPAEISGANTFRKLEVRNTAGISLPSGTTTVTDSMIVHSNARVNITGGFLNINGNLRLRNSGSTVFMTDGQINLRGNFDNTANGSFTTSTTGGAINFNGTTAQSLLGRVRFRDLTVSNTSVAGLTIVSDTVRVSRDLNINTNARVTMASGNMIVNNNVRNDGTMTFTGSTTHLVSSVNQALFGTPSFGNLVINKPAGTITLPTNVNVRGKLNLVNGTLNMVENNINVDTLDLRTGGVINLSQGTLTINGGFNNTFGGLLNQLAGTVSFAGTTKGIIRGNTTLLNVNVQKTTNGQDTLFVPNTLTVLNSLTLNGGVVNTGINGMVSLATLATMSDETNARRVIGRLTQTKPVDGNFVAFAGIGVGINPRGSNLGNVQTLRHSGLGMGGFSHATPPEFPTSKSIDAIWRITTASPPADSADLSLSWPTAVDNGNSRALNFFAYRRPAPYDGNWIGIRRPVRPVNNTITVTTPEFSEWTVSDENNPLPVEFLSFQGRWNEESKSVDLVWVTAQEKDNDYFVIERAVGNQDRFEAIGSVKGSGTTYLQTRYNYFDKSAPTGMIYYRLRQVDYNGTYSFSRTIGVYAGKEVAGNWRVFPNPTASTFNIEGFGIEGDNAKIKVFDMLGKVVVEQDVALQFNTLKSSFNITHLPSGLYMIKVQDETGKVTTLKVERK